MEAMLSSETENNSFNNFQKLNILQEQGLAVLVGFWDIVGSVWWIHDLHLAVQSLRFILKLVILAQEALQFVTKNWSEMAFGVAKYKSLKNVLMFSPSWNMLLQLSNAFDGTKIGGCMCEIFKFEVFIVFLLFVEK